jgi:hypothetical protein
VVASRIAEPSPPVDTRTEVSDAHLLCHAI